MKFNCRSYQDRYNESCSWHYWFAWYPVSVGHQDCRWLEKVWTRRIPAENYMCDDKWEYTSKE